MFAKPFTFDNIPDLSGKVALVTGANTGMGFVTAREIARKGAHTFVCSRSEEKGEKAVKSIKELTGNQNVEFLQLNLSSLNDVKSAAQKFLDKNLPIHILINNAGIMATPFELSVDGIENQFATNHLGHFLWTKTLLPKIIESAPARIVTVSSWGHNVTVSGGVDFDNINTENHSILEKYNIWARYGQSKLANILMTNELDRRLADKPIYCNSVHPGVVKSELTRGIAESWGQIVVPFVTVQNALFAKSADDGALNQLYCATSPEIEEKNIRGKYLVPYAVVTQPSAYARDEKLAEKLWKFSEDLIEEKLNAKTSE